MIGTVITSVCVVVLVVLILTHDPPSGYNMGTGDSFIPIILAVVGVIVGIVLSNYGI